MVEPRPHVLVVDDDVGILAVLDVLLTNAGYRVSTASGGREGIVLAQASPPAAILLDVEMPGLSGLEVCATLRSLPETQATPVAMLSVRSEIADRIAAMQVGADDYVGKPFTKRRLLDVVARLARGRSGDPSDLVAHAPGDPRSRALLFDPVTGLPTLPFVVDALRDRLRADESVAVVLVDVDADGRVEGWQGWETFDEVLRQVARTLRRLLGTLFSTEDLLAVDGPAGSEFYVFSSVPAGSEGGPQEAARARALSLEEAVREGLSEGLGGRLQAPVGVHAGWATVRFTPLARPERLVRRALRDAALLVATREEEAVRRWREDFRDVLAERSIETLFQPIVELSTGAVFAHEALSRGPVERGFGLPEVLFEHASLSGQTWELESVCIAFAAERCRPLGDGVLFVNVEPELVRGMPARGLEVLRPLQGIASRVVLEITERGGITDWEGFRRTLGTLKALGFRVAVDDAGSGWASLQSIAELRPDFLKVSSYLVTGLSRDGIKRDIVEMLARLGDRLGATLVAEGIETEEDLTELKRIGVRYGQGYLLGRPVPAPPGA